MNQIPLVVGGNINNNIIIFNSTAKANSINFTIDTTCDVLVVGGGGGGGGANGGGGGGGSVINKTITFKKGIYVIEIGTGGTGGQYADQNNIYGSSGINGGISHIYGNGIDIYAAGGGGGGGGFENETAENGSEAGSLHTNNYSSGGGGGGGKFDYAYRGISINNFSGDGANGTALTSGGGGGAVGNGSSGNGGSGYAIPNNSTKFNNIKRFAGGGAGSSGVAVDGGGNFNVNGTNGMGGGGGGGSSNGANGGDGVIMIIFYNKINSGTTASSGTLKKTLSSTITSSAVIPNSASSTLTQEESSLLLTDYATIYSSNLSNYDNIISNNASLLKDIYNNYINNDNLYNFNEDNKNDLIENYINNSLYLTNDYNSQVSFNDYSYLIDIIGNIYENIYNLFINLKINDDLSFNRLINNITEIHITNNKTEIINNSIINLNSSDIHDDNYLLLQLSSDDLNINNMIFKQLEPAEYPPIKYSEKNKNNTYYTITIANHCYGNGYYNLYSSTENDPSLLFDNNYSQDFSFNNNTYNPDGYFIPSDSKNNYLVDKKYEGEWFVMELPQFVVIDGYYIINSKNFPNNAPSIFKVYGSTNGVKWDIIDDCNTSAVYSNNKYQKILTKETILYKYVCFTFSQIANNNSGTLKINQIKLLGRELQINKIGSLADYNLTYKKSQIKIINDDNNSQNKFLNNNLYNIFNFNSTDIIMNLYYYKFFYKIIKYQNTLTKILYYDQSDLNSDQIDINTRGLNLDIYDTFDSKNYLSTIKKGSPYTNGVNITDFSSLSASTNGAIENNNNSTFTCKWSGYIYIPKGNNGDYNFKLNIIGFGNIWISDKEINIPDIKDKKIADNNDNFTINLDADKFYSIVIIYGHLSISNNAYLNLNITGPYITQSKLFYNKTINTSSYYDNNINDTLTSLNKDVSDLIKSNDVSNYILYKQQSDYINTITDVKSTDHKYAKSKGTTNLNIFNYKKNYANINNIEFLSNILLITLIIILIIIIITLVYNFKENIKIKILSNYYEFTTKTTILGGLLILLIVIIIILNYYKNNLNENFENPITNKSIIDYLNKINELLYQINKHMVNLSVFDTNDLTYLNANIKNTNVINDAKKAENISVNVKSNNNITNIDFNKYIYYDIFCCILVIILIISIIIYLIFPDYYTHICIITIIIFLILIYIFNFYSKQMTNLDYNKKYLDFDNK